MLSKSIGNTESVRQNRKSWNLDHMGARAGMSSYPASRMELPVKAWVWSLLIRQLNYQVQIPRRAGIANVAAFNST